MITLYAKESPIGQGSEEQVAYRLLTTPWGSSPTSVSVVLRDSEGVDISATCLSGLPSVSGNYITSPLVIGLIKGQKYLLKYKFTVSGNVVTALVEIRGTE